MISSNAQFVVNWIYDMVDESDLQEFGSQLKCWTWSEFRAELLETLAEIGRRTGEQFDPTTWDIGDQAWQEAYDELHYDFS
jgi:thiamine biosynthesis lipoprotein ApbE